LVSVFATELPKTIEIGQKRWPKSNSGNPEWGKQAQNIPLLYPVVVLYQLVIPLEQFHGRISKPLPAVLYSWPSQCHWNLYSFRKSGQEETKGFSNLAGGSPYNLTGACYFLRPIFKVGFDFRVTENEKSSRMRVTSALIRVASKRVKRIRQEMLAQRTNLTLEILQPL